MRQLLILWLTASAAALVAGGCNAVPTAPPATAPPHARWSPGYMGAIGNTLGTYEAWSNHLLFQLAARAGMDDYWRLVDLVTRYAPQADYLVILEQMPGNSDYTFVLLVLTKDEAFLFMPQVPLPGLDAARAARDVRDPVWGKVRSPEAVKAYFAELEKAGIWQAGPAVAVPDAGRAVEQRPWLIHLYRRDGAAAASFAVEGPILDPAVLSGRQPLAAVPRDGIPAWYQRLWGEYDAATREDLLRAYAASYPHRLILNGLLRIAYREAAARQRGQAKSYSN